MTVRIKTEDEQGNISVLSVPVSKERELQIVGKVLFEEYFGGTIEHTKQSFIDALARLAQDHGISHFEKYYGIEDVEDDD